MVRGLLLFASVVSAVSELVQRHNLLLPAEEYSVATVSSLLLLSSRELEAWSTDLPVEDRIAIFRRGLLRYEQTQKH